MKLLPELWLQCKWSNFLIRLFYPFSTFVLLIQRNSLNFLRGLPHYFHRCFRDFFFSVFGDPGDLSLGFALFSIELSPEIARGINLFLISGEFSAEIFFAKISLSLGVSSLSRVAALASFFLGTLFEIELSSSDDVSILVLLIVSNSVLLCFSLLGLPRKLKDGNVFVAPIILLLLVITIIITIIMIYTTATSIICT